MSNMQFETMNYPGDVQIISRGKPESKALTLDFTSVNDKTSTGKKVVKAGTPIDINGVVANSASVLGILLHDVVEDRPQGALVQKGYIKKAVAEAHCGVTYAEAVKTALPMVVFE